MSARDLFLDWAQIDTAAPRIAAIMRTYLAQIATTLRPATVRNTDQALRCFAQFLIQQNPEISTVADVRRSHIEDYKPWLAARTGQRGRPVSVNTRAHRLGNLRTFFIRIHDWGWHEAPPTVPILFGDLPRQEKPLPKVLDDAAAARFLRAARAQS